MKSKECKECGRIFVPRCGTQRYCDGPHQTACKYCGRIFDYTCSPNEKPKYCSQACINEGKLDDDSIDIDNTTEKEIMEAHKFVRIYDSGVIRWEYTR